MNEYTFNVSTEMTGVVSSDGIPLNFWVISDSHEESAKEKYNFITIIY